MGRLKQQQIEREDEILILAELEQDRTLDFDLRDANDPEWWKEQDTEMVREDAERIEILAEIEEYRHQGYM